MPTRTRPLATLAVLAALPAFVLLAATRLVLADAHAATVRASAEASVAAAQPQRRDRARRERLRVGGPARWRALLRFRVPGAATPVRRATLRVWVARRPARPVTAVRLALRPAWREGRVTYARAPRTAAHAGSWAPARQSRCPRDCRAGAWLTIDVTRAVRRSGTVGFALRATTPRPVLLGTRRDRRRAPRLVVERRSSAAPGAGTTGSGTAAPSPGSVPGGTLVAAAGDLACEPGQGDPCRQQDVSDLVLREGPAAFLALGDLAYPEGTLEQFRAWFAPSFGRLGDRVRPVPGNHEYRSDATGYFDFFNGEGVATGRAGERGRGWYSFDVGGWHAVALNSECADAGGCGPGSPQETWLRADLAAHPAACTLAFWHRPRFSSGPHGDEPDVSGLWQALQDAGAEVVLSGHDHHYERFAPQDATGAPSPRGLRQFIAGSGGKGTRPLVRTAPNSEARDTGSLGALLLTLRPGGYDWRFAAATGSFSDAGSGACR